MMVCVIFFTPKFCKIPEKISKKKKTECIEIIKKDLDIKETYSKEVCDFRNNKVHEYKKFKEYNTNNKSNIDLLINNFIKEEFNNMLKISSGIPACI